MSGGDFRYEANLSAQSAPPAQGARISSTHAHAGGPRGSGPAAAKGTEADRGVAAMAEWRLKRRADFGQVIRGGRTFGDRYLVLFVLQVGAVHRTRVGFATQRSVGSAVKRNRVRRRLRALYRLYADSVVAGADLVFLGKKSMIDASWDDLQRSMRRALRQAGYLKG